MDDPDTSCERRETDVYKYVLCKYSTLTYIGVCCICTLNVHDELDLKEN